MPTWNDLFNEQENRWDEPFEDVVSLLDDGVIKKNSRVLDLGSGAGRHLKYLQTNGISSAGMDISWNGLTFSQSLLQKHRLPVVLSQADMSDALSYADNSFDCLISIHVIFHNLTAKIRFTLQEIYRVLKPGGIALITLNSIYSYRFGTGVELESGTWVPDIGKDKGIPHHFSSLEDLADLLHQFKVLKVILLERIDEGNLSSHWVVTAQKPI